MWVLGDVDAFANLLNLTYLDLGECCRLTGQRAFWEKLDEEIPSENLKFLLCLGYRQAKQRLKRSLTKATVRIAHYT